MLSTRYLRDPNSFEKYFPSKHEVDQGITSIDTHESVLPMGSGLAAKSCLTLATLWTVACQVRRSMGFSRQEYWSGLPFPSPIVLLIWCRSPWISVLRLP